MWSSNICESTLFNDTCHPQCVILSSTDAVEGSLVVIHSRSALGVVFACVCPKDEPGSVHGFSSETMDSCSSETMDSCSSETMDTGFTEQVEIDMTEERQQLFQLIPGQVGCDP